ncbi:SAM-dependent chlorinase/fluorinase [Aphanothece sacrum]|uniref:SAM-dependent chlorinase/fluorinase n=2 Tax=Aphanothece sacrum TaxID=1122 RepID=UPI001D131722|nr:SAM-dependent chlorinase/fluorinase [Aphanothece sacrum]
MSTLLPDRKMSKISVIVFLTDFGLKDGYVEMMKGAIAKINLHLSINECLSLLSHRNRISCHAFN